jgi:acetyltransferase
MKLLIGYARAEGLKRLVGEVLHENTTMLNMCRELGFSITGSEDPAVANVTLDLNHPAVETLSKDNPFRPKSRIGVS